MTEAFWSLSADQAFAVTDGAPTGLGKAEAASRLRRDGANAIGEAQHRRTVQLRDPDLSTYCLQHYAGRGLCRSHRVRQAPLLQGAGKTPTADQITKLVT